MGAGIGRAYKETMAAIAKENGRGYDGLNVSVTYDSSVRVYAAEAVIGDGRTDAKGRHWMDSNYYQIMFYRGGPDVAIYKATAQSIVDLEYVSGHPPRLTRYDPYTDSTEFYGSHCHGDLSVDEVVKKLVARDWATYKNVSHNTENIRLLHLAQQHLIKILVHNGDIIYHEPVGRYVTRSDYDFYTSFGPWVGELQSKKEGVHGKEKKKEGPKKVCKGISR